MKNTKNVDAHKKGYTDFCRQTSPSPQNGHVLPQMDFPQFPTKILLFSKNLFYNKKSVT